MKANKVIRLVSGCLLVVAMTAIFWACNKESISEPSGSDVLTSDVEINKVVQNYFDRKNDLVIGGATQEEKNKFLEITSNDKNARKEVEENESIEKIYSENHISINTSKTQIEIDKLVEIGTGIYEARVSTLTSMSLSNESLSSTNSDVYKITLEKRDGKWLVVNDEPLNFIGDSKYRNSIIDKLNFVTPQESKNSSSKIQAGTYNRYVASQFATDNANKNIICSEWFTSKGGDCTNFVSRSLVQGNWKQDFTWFYLACGNNQGASNAWGGANPFRNYLLRSSRVQPTLTNIKGLQHGDVISCDFNGDGSFDHTVMVTYIDKYGNRYLSYHDKNTQNKAYAVFVAEVTSSYKRSPTLNHFKLKDSY